MFLIKLDTSGDTTWTVTAGGSGTEYLFGLTVTVDGGYVAAGATNSYGHGATDVWLVRYPGFSGVGGFAYDSVSGEPLPNVWVSAVDQPMRVRTDAFGYYVLTLPPEDTYDVITYGQCVERDTAFGIPVFTDSLTMHDFQLATPNGLVPQTSINLVAQNHDTASEPLVIYNDGLGLLDFMVAVTPVQPASSWLSVIPPSGSVLPGDSAIVAVQVHADTTDNGVFDFYGFLDVHMNSCPDSVIHVDVIATILDAEEEFVPQPLTFSLSAYPNPFNPATTLTFSLPHDATVSLVIYDLLGREMRRLHDAPATSGVHRVSFDASDLPSGIYVARLQAGATTISQKLVMLK
jgi:hypothetical protein